MIRFLQSRGHGYTVKSVRQARDAPAIDVINYDAFIRARSLRRATYLFTDLDRLGFWDLEHVSHLYLQMKNAGLRVLNNPAVVRSRYPLLRALRAAGLNDFNVYRVDELETIEHYPVFVRKVHGHREPLSDLLQTKAELLKVLDAAIAGGTPRENLLIVEFAAEPLRPGLFRKLSAFRMGNAIIPHISVHDTVWLVKYGRRFDDMEDVYQEEYALLQNNPYAGHLKKVFDIAGIEYGRVDFGLYRGRIQVYEINTNPYVTPQNEHPSAARTASLKLSWENYLAGLRAIDSDGGGSVRIGNGTLQKHRPWKNLLVRTRKVP
ncbi:MAG TPA: hypothetical protein VH597_17960 [Verrucomicrobiae bacterium]|jgi:hypothetical protein|nr:hypothetical protein [Verrucomicrobiae bacterium]